MPGLRPGEEAGRIVPRRQGWLLRGELEPDSIQPDDAPNEFSARPMPRKAAPGSKAKKAKASKGNDDAAKAGMTPRPRV